MKKTSAKFARTPKPAPLTAEQLALLAKGLAHRKHGGPTRNSIRTYLDVFSDPKSSAPQRKECMRLLTQSLANAEGIARGTIKCRPLAPSP